MRFIKNPGLFILLILFVFTFIIQCSLGRKKKRIVPKTVKQEAVVPKQTFTSATKNLNINGYSEYERSLMRQGYFDIRQYEPSIRVDLGYAKPYNFTGKQLYTRISHGFVHPRMAEKLRKANVILKETHPNYTLQIFDALRPNSIQYKMWNAVEGTPKQKYVAHPGTGSLHNYGLSVDLTIVNTTTNAQIPMGTPIDHLGREAEFRYNDELLAEGKITRQEKENRELLRQVMVKAGFRPINSEWWHFNTYNADQVKREYKMVR